MSPSPCFSVPVARVHVHTCVRPGGVHFLSACCLAIFETPPLGPCSPSSWASVIYYIHLSRPCRLGCDGRSLLVRHAAETRAHASFFPEVFCRPLLVISSSSSSINQSINQIVHVIMSSPCPTPPSHPSLTRLSPTHPPVVTHHPLPAKKQNNSPLSPPGHGDDIQCMRPCNPYACMQPTTSVDMHDDERRLRTRWTALKPQPQLLPALASSCQLVNTFFLRADNYETGPVIHAELFAAVVACGGLWSPS